MITWTAGMGMGKFLWDGDKITGKGWGWRKEHQHASRRRLIMTIILSTKYRVLMKRPVTAVWDYRRLAPTPLSYLQSEIQFLERTSYFCREAVHPLAFLEGDDDVRSPIFDGNLGHDLLHQERLRQIVDDVVQYRLYLRVTFNNGTDTIMSTKNRMHGRIHASYATTNQRNSCTKNFVFLSSF